MFGRFKPALLPGLSALGLLAAAAHAEAQSTGLNSGPASAESSQTSGTLEEIVVTAQKREQALSDVGLSIQVLSSSDLARRNITEAADLVKVVSAFTVAKGADGTPVYTLRGVGFNSLNLGAQPTVSIYIDEAGLPYGPLTQGPIFDLERVEVLKGPQGTLFGQNSTGGAINYIAAKPTDTFNARVKGSASRFNMFQGEAFVSGPITSSLSARFAVTGAHSDDWQYNYLRDDSIGEQRKTGARLLLDWQPSDRLTTALNLNGWIDKSDNQVPQFLAPLPRVPTQAIPELFTIPTPPGDDRPADWDPDRPFDRDNKFGQAVLRADYSLSDTLTIVSLSNYARADIDSIYEHDGTRFGFGYVTTSGHVEVFTQELRLDGNYDSGTFLVGGNYQDDNSYESSLQIFDRTSSTINVLSPPLPPPGLGSFTGNENRGRQSNRSVGVFASVEYNLSDQLTAVGGMRYTELRHDSQECSADPGNGEFAAVINQVVGLLTGAPGLIPPGGCISLDDTPGGNLASAPFPTQSFDEDNVSWRGGLNYKPRPDTLIYGAVSRGYKGGNYPVINASARSQFVPVTQEELTSYELGLKAGMGQILQFNGAVYYYDYKDKQLLTNKNDAVFGLLNVLANIPESRVYGLDIDATLRPLSDLTIRGAVGYANSKIEKNSDGTDFSGFDVFTAPAVLSGRSFNFAPEWTANADVEYRFDLASRLEGFIGGDIAYNSATFADLAESPVMKIDSYTIYGVRAGMESADGRWQATVFGRNIGNKYYWTNVQAGYDTLYRITGEPRIYGVSLAYTF